MARGHDPVVLVDADRQASLAEWLEERPVEGVTVVEAPSERTLARAMNGHEGLAIVDTPPGDERLVQSALDSADAVVVPTRAGGVEFSRVVATLDMIPARTPRGVVICSARLGTNDLDETIAWWRAEEIPVWGWSRNVLASRLVLRRASTGRGSSNTTKFCGAPWPDDAEMPRPDFLQGHFAGDEPTIRVTRGSEAANLAVGQPG